MLQYDSRVDDFDQITIIEMGCSVHKIEMTIVRPGEKTLAVIFMQRKVFRRVEC